MKTKRFRLMKLGVAVSGFHTHTMVQDLNFQGITDLESLAEKLMEIPKGVYGVIVSEEKELAIQDIWEDVKIPR